jgi:tripartite-type tricarboxylate transporter receptor subunit TctC
MTTRISRRPLLAIAGASSLLAAPRRVSAQAYPTRPVRIIVPYTPGGFTDLSTRLVSEPLARVLGQPVVVENRPGANSILGAGQAATSAPDGYTFVTVLPAHAANATLQGARLPFNAVTSFSPVSVIALSPLVLAATAKMPIRSLRDMIAHAKSGRLTYGSSGIGSTAHLAMELLQIREGFRGEHVPYRGTQPALQDLIAGNIVAMFDVNSALRPQIEARNITGLAVASAQRPPFATDIPTLAEGGVADFSVSTWSMLLAPAGTPREIVTRISSEVTKILREPAMTARLLEMGLLADGRGPDETGAFLRAEVDRWGEVIRTGRITVE